MEKIMDDYTITTDKEKIDVEYVHAFLSHSYWAENIPIEIVRRCIKGSLTFSVFYKKQQVGFARVISDYASFAYLADVFIDPEFRGKGLSKWLMKTILEHPDLQGLRRFLLTTRDSHWLYKQFGFEPLKQPERFMLIQKQDIYKTGISDQLNY